MKLIGYCELAVYEDLSKKRILADALRWGLAGNCDAWKGKEVISKADEEKGKIKN